jgi:signal transduction histidine kinase
LVFILIFGALFWFVQCLGNKLKNRIKELEVMLKATLIKQRLERKKLTEKFHDGLKNDIIAAKNFISLSEMPAGDINHTTFLNDAKTALDGAFENACLLSNELMSSLIRQGKIIPAFEDYFAALHEKTGSRFLVTLKTEEFELTPANAYEIYHITAELCDNIINHNTATQINLILSKQKTSTVFELIDNGQPYDFVQCYHESDGNGLKAIQARLIILSGTLIQENVSNGNHLIIKIID